MPERANPAPPESLPTEPSPALQETTFLTAVAAPIYAVKNAADRQYTPMQAATEAYDLFQAAIEFRIKLAARQLAAERISAADSKE
jgi:hypothetical protein